MHWGCLTLAAILAPNSTQNTEHRLRTHNTNTENIRPLTQIYIALLFWISDFPLAFWFLFSNYFCLQFDLFLCTCGQTYLPPISILLFMFSLCTKPAEKYCHLIICGTHFDLQKFALIWMCDSVKFGQIKWLPYLNFNFWCGIHVMTTQLILTWQFHTSICHWR